MVLAGVVFSGYNSTEVPLWLGVELPAQRLGVWVSLAFAIGGFSGLILGFGLFKRIKYKVKISQLETRLKQSEKMLESLQSGVSNNSSSKGNSWGG